MVSAIANGYVSVEKDPMTPAEIPGTQAISITLTPIYAVAFQVVGDELLGYSVDSPDSAYFHNTRVLSDLDCEAKLLKAKLPGTETAAYALRDSIEPAPASVHMLLLERGLVTSLVHLRKVETIDEAETVDVSSFPSSENCWPTLVRILGADGRPVDLDAFVLVIDGVVVPVKPGMMMLPAGKHGIICTDSTLQGSYSPNEVEIPGNLDIQILRPFRECRLQVIDGDGNECERFLLRVKSPGTTITSIVYDVRNLEFALPIGQAEVNVIVWGYSQTTQAITVLPGDGSQNILIALDNQESKK